MIAGHIGHYRYLEKAVETVTIIDKLGKLMRIVATCTQKVYGRGRRH